MSNNSLLFQDDEALIRSLAIGDSKAINFIYKTNYPTIEKMVFKMNGSMEEAYDVFQDSMTILYEKAKANDLELSCKLNTYLTSIAKHIWMRKLSSKKRQSFTILHDDVDYQVAVEDDVDRFVEFEKNVSKLSACFEQIGEPCNSILKAFYVQNKSMNTIAEEFGYTNPENAKTQKYKCLNRIRKLFFHENEQQKKNERII
jgi:RNA polymerase sigma factor (sigma-70 family)